MSVLRRRYQSRVVCLQRLDRHWEERSGCERHARLSSNLQSGHRCEKSFFLDLTVYFLYGCCARGSKTGPLVLHTGYKIAEEIKLRPSVLVHHSVRMNTIFEIPLSRFKVVFYKKE